MSRYVKVRLPVHLTLNKQQVFLIQLSLETSILKASVPIANPFKDSEFKIVASYLRRISLDSWLVSYLEPL